jgi:hypothetical protein
MIENNLEKLTHIPEFYETTHLFGDNNRAARQSTSGSFVMRAS